MALALSDVPVWCPCFATFETISYPFVPFKQVTSMRPAGQISEPVCYVKTSGLTSDLANFYPMNISFQSHEEIVLETLHYIAK